MAPVQKHRGSRYRRLKRVKGKMEKLVQLVLNKETNTFKLPHREEKSHL